MRKTLRQAAMKFLHEKHGLAPTYLPDLDSTEAFNAAFEIMPLIAVWNEEKTNGKVFFSISINGFLVFEALAQFLSTDDPWLDEELAHLVADLKQLTDSSMAKSVKKTGLMPSEICAGLGLGWEHLGSRTPGADQ